MTDMGFGFAFVLNDMVSSPATQIGNSFNGLVQKTTGATQKLGGAMDSMASSMNLGVFQKWGQLDLANQITNFGQGVTSFFERSIDKAGEFSDKYTDIQKTAGLTNTEVRQLADELSGLDTRTSLGSLLDIAKVGGAVGVTGKEMQGFVESTNMAAVALGDEFKGGVEGVVKPLGTMKNLFAETKNLDFGTAVNNIGSAINQLGGEGLATGGNIADFTARIGQLGALAPSITQTMGLGAALEELGINAEIAAGGVTNIMLMAGQNIGAYSKQLKMSEEQFKSLMNTDPNEMFLKLAESMQGMSSTQVIDTMKNLKIGSQESIKVMSLLANKTDLVTKRQQSAAEAFAKGTSLQDEYNLKNESLGASMAKLANKFEVFMLKVGENIAPVFQPFFDGFTKLINLATAFINTPLGTNIAKVVAILGAGALVFGTSAVSIITFDLALAAMGTTMTGLIAAAGSLLVSLAPFIVVGAAIAGSVYFMVEAWNSFGEALEQSNESYGRFAESGIMRFMQQLGGTMQGISAVWQSATSKGFELDANMNSGLKELGILDTVLAIGTWITRIKGFFEGVSFAISQIEVRLRPAFDSFSRFGTMLFEVLGKSFGMFGKNTDAMSGFINLGSKITVFILEPLISGLQLLAGFADWLTKMEQQTGLVSNIWLGLGTTFGVVFDIFSAGIGMAWNTFTALGGHIMNVLGIVGKLFTDSSYTIGQAFTDIFSSFGTAIWDLITGIFSRLGGLAADMMDRFGLADQANALREKMSTGINFEAKGESLNNKIGNLGGKFNNLFGTAQGMSDLPQQATPNGFPQGEQGRSVMPNSPMLSYQAAATQSPTVMATQNQVQTPQVFSPNITTPTPVVQKVDVYLDGESIPLFASKIEAHNKIEESRR